MKYFNLDKQILFNFLIFFFPLSYLAGRAIVELLLFLSFVVTLIYCKKWKDYFFDKNFIIVFLSLYYLSVFFSTFINIEILSQTTDQNLLLKSFFNFRYVIYIISIWFIFQEIKLDKRFFVITIFCYLFFLADGYIQFFTGKNLLGYSMPSGRISGIFGDEYIFGSYIQKVIPIIIILFYLTFNSNFKNKTLYFFLVLFLSTNIILVSGDRAAIILFIFYLAICFLLVSNHRKIFLMNFLISGIVLFVIVSFNLGKNLAALDQRYNPKSNFNAHSAQTKNNHPIIKYIPKDHFGHYLVVKEMVKDNLYFGKGLKSFRFMCNGKLGNLYPVEGGVCSTHPHNYYLQSISAGGIISLFFLFSIFILFSFKMLNIFLKLFKRINHNELLTFSTISIFVYLWPLIPTGNFFSNWISGFNCFALGLYLFINSKINSEKNK
tara:strand:+ start:11785 stop:13089 length:1305 start_codon:yes stop_codon:yes gene_type:complete